MRTIHYFVRKPREGEFSMERAFAPTIEHIRASSEFDVRVLVAPVTSEGLLRRLTLILWATFNQGNINHIIGDIHFASLLTSREKTYITIHDLAPLNRLRGLRKALFELFWIRLPLKRARAIAVVSAATLREIEPYLNPGVECVIIPNSVSIEPARPISTQFSRPLLLQVGCRSNKNIARLAEAMRGLDCTLLVIGKLLPHDRQALAANEVKYKEVAGLTDSEMQSYYEVCDAVCFVSTYEGFGLPIIEAQAAGRPVITSRRSPMQDVAGDGAILVDPDSVEEIRYGLRRLLSDSGLRATLIKAGYENVRRYSSRSVGDAYLGLYRQCIPIGPTSQSGQGG